MAVPELAINRLKRDYTQLLTEPIDNVWAHPLEDNILEWHYVIRGPTDTPFESGLYHGKLMFSMEYPLKGPSIYMLTPNGKFSVNRPICVAGISNLHPERWSAANTVSSVLISFLSFMIDDKCGFFSGMALHDGPRAMLPHVPPPNRRQMLPQMFTPSPPPTVPQIKDLAKRSWRFNLNDQIFCKYFPQLVDECKRLNAQNV